MDPRDRFTTSAPDYDRFRPDYPEALFDWLVAFVPLGAQDVVIDIGCGTGISARQLAARGLEVVAVDPNAAMLEVARAQPTPGVTYVQTDGERLEVPVPRCAAIVGGQSFHWLDMAVARARFRELTDGWVVPFWNLRRDGAPFNDAYEALLRAWSPEYAMVAPEHRVAGFRGQVESQPVEFPHHQDMDRQGLIGRAWSSSYIRNVVRDHEGFDAALNRLFDEHAQQGRVRFEYRTVALPFR